MRFPMKNCFSLLSEEAKMEIGSLVNFKEIENALFSIVPLKALGLDDLHVIFL